MSRKNIIIIGAAGRDFHNFNTCFRENDNYNVVSFTAAQIPDIDGRKYPKELAGKLYPDGIPISPEDSIPDLIKKYEVADCVFSYSDITYEKVMSVSAIVNAAGANFVLLGPTDTMVKSVKPVIAVGAVRTGCGKSQTSRKVIELLLEKGYEVYGAYRRSASLNIWRIHELGLENDINFVPFELYNHIQTYLHEDDTFPGPLRLPWLISYKAYSRKDPDRSWHKEYAYERV